MLAIRYENIPSQFDNGFSKSQLATSIALGNLGVVNQAKSFQGKREKDLSFTWTEFLTKMGRKFHKVLLHVQDYAMYYSFSRGERRKFLREFHLTSQHLHPVTRHPVTINPITRHPVTRHPVTRHWNVDRPRLLHASAHTVFLVGAVYVCEYGHQILSTDPRILMLIPDHLIPFVLLHRTAFLKDFLQTVILLVQGLSLRAAENCKRMQFVSSLVRQGSSTMQSSGIERIGLQDSICSKLMERTLPSDDSIRKCF